jgi:hypothetical protein
MSSLDKLRHAADDLTVILEHHDRAIRSLEDQQRGQPGSGFGGGGHRGSSSPVESALGLSGPGEDGEVHGDRAAATLAHVGKMRDRVIRDLHMLRRVIEAEVPRAPTDKQRREVERANTEDPDRFCEHCTRHRPTGMAEDVYRTGTVSGNLPEPMALCRFCYDRVIRKGRLPALDEIRLNVKRLERVT